jgi:hypothetical protein
MFPTTVPIECPTLPARPTGVIPPAPPWASANPWENPALNLTTGELLNPGLALYGGSPSASPTRASRGPDTSPYSLVHLTVGESERCSGIPPTQRRPASDTRVAEGLNWQHRPGAPLSRRPNAHTDISAPTATIRRPHGHLYWPSLRTGYSRHRMEFEAASQFAPRTRSS